MSADFYWVGGSGNWSDISHWKTTSGGNVGHAQAPSPEDNVYFDSNSFSGPNQIVTLNNDINFCRNFDWSSVTNSPALIAGPQTRLTIYGDLTLTASMIFEFNGSLILSGENLDRTIDFSGLPVAKHFQINGSGSWHIVSEIEVDSMLEILMGTVDFNGQRITTDHLYITGSGSKVINLSNSEVQINGAFLDEMYESDEIDIKSCVIETSNLTLDAVGSLFSFNAKNPAFWYRGTGDLLLNNVTFTSSVGKAILTDWDSDPNISMNAVLFNSSASVDGKMTAITLALTAGRVYDFESNQIFNFENILAVGSCSESVVITATDTGLPTTFVVSSELGASMAYVTLRDIHGQGNAAFTVQNGVDLGNNVGWTFTDSNAENFFWIGGSGDWTDPQHWSFASGGAPSGCVPTGKDDVFFDINSFNGPSQVVTVNRENIFLHSMTWDMVTGNPSLEGEEDFTIVVTGSLEFDEGMSNNFEGDFFFESGNIGNTIMMNGRIFQKDITFSGVDGEWSFLDAVEINQTLWFLSGSLITNGRDLTCLRLLSEVELPRRLDISDSYIHLRDFMYDYPYWTINLNNYMFVADNSTIEFTGANYGSLWHYGNYTSGGLPTFNNVIFSNYLGTFGINNYNVPVGDPMAIIDSLIYNSRGELHGSNLINYLQFRAGYDYTIDSQNGTPVQEISEITASGSCEDGLTRIAGSVPGTYANFELNQDFIFEKLDLQDIRIQGSGSLTANNSVDEGRNENITFTDFDGRTLFWVGNGGNWEDPDHWSLTSGGAGGQCIPTALDDVVFDINSFSEDFQQVNSEGARYRHCHDITWTGTSNMPSFGDNFLVVSGSVEYDDSFTNYVWQHIFTSSDTEEVRANGQMFTHLLFRGEGNTVFKDDFFAHEMYHHSGSFTLEDINVSLGGIYFYNASPKTAIFMDSRLEIRGTTGNPDHPPFRDYSGGNTTIEPGTSEVNLSGHLTGIFAESLWDLNKIRFSNPAGTGYLLTHYISDDVPTPLSLTAQKITFSGNGNVVGLIETDTLIGAPGKTYNLASGRTHKVNNFLQMIGNNCTPIELRSSTHGIQTTIEMPAGGRVLANFVQMQDNIGSGGADFNAGSRSTDIGSSNLGWIFEDAPEIQEAGFLGSDRALCTGEDLILDAYSFSPNETYLWSDGSIDSTIIVNNPGVYFVEVQFESSCILRDTIEIFTAQDIMADLPPTLSGCEGDLIVLDAEVPINTAIYTWNDGSNAPVLEAVESGTYSVDVDVDGCVTSASTEVTIVVDPGVDLGDDRSYCEGSIFVVNAPISSDNFLWQDGSTSSEITSDQAGLYWLEINLNSCAFRDSVEIGLVSPPQLELGSDTLVCDNQTFFLTIENPNGYAVLWQDGSTSNVIEVVNEGKYLVTLDDNGCTNQDSVNIAFIDAPQVDLGEDIVKCEGEEHLLAVPNPNLAFAWEDGNQEAERNIDISGIYTLEVEEDGCFSSDSIVIEFKPNPRINLGMDTTVCDDMPYIITAVSDQGTISWSDGSTGSSFEVVESGQITVTVNDDGCFGADSIQVNFKECIRFQAFIPNAFSPNEDGFNDEFEVFFPDGLVIETYFMKIYDRWGNSVFSSEIYGNFWDGKIKSAELDRGVYTYFLNVSYIDDFGPSDVSISGDISIME